MHTFDPVFPVVEIYGVVYSHLYGAYPGTKFVAVLLVMAGGAWFLLQGTGLVNKGSSAL